jgi:hypothetical protein
MDGPPGKYHHLGIPTKVVHGDETYLASHKVHVSGYGRNPYGIEWMRYEPGSPVPELVKTIPHVAFEVEDLEAAISGKDVLIPPNSPSEGVRVAFIVDDGAPVEFLEVRKKA